MEQADYVMGHSDDELARLERQTAVLGPTTERLLKAAGAGPGSRVLDVGCGTGDVAFQAARLVGPTGSVAGIDGSAEAVARARARAAALGLSAVEFHSAALAEYSADEQFDIVIGRYVLIHQPDPAVFLRAAARHVRPGGVLAFHEMDGKRGGRSVPPTALLQQVNEWIKLAMESALPHYDAGSRLAGYFLAAGLPYPELACETPVSGGPDSVMYEWGAETVRTLLPLLLSRLGVPADAVGIETLADRLRDATVAAGAQIEAPPQYIAWARI